MDIRVCRKDLIIIKYKRDLVHRTSLLFSQYYSLAASKACLLRPCGL